MNETTNLSTRINKNSYDELIKEAKGKGISLNSLVCSIFRHHITWEKYANELGIVPVSKHLIEELLKNCDDKTIKYISNKIGTDIPKELLYLSGNSLSFNSMMNILEINGARFGIVKHTINDNVHTIVLHHSIGENFSKLLAYSHQKLAEELDYKLEICQMNKNIVCLNFQEPK